MNEYFPKVSVVVPNYNHSVYLRERMASILNQTYTDFEIIIMDDHSGDGSVEILKSYENHKSVSKILLNSTNSGNTYKQWNKGISEAAGEYIWIAESDDYAHPQFLEKTIPLLDSNPGVGIAYSQSWVVDEKMEVKNSWQQYTDKLDASHWSTDFISNGRLEIIKYLLYQNTIPNASAVVFRKNLFYAVGKANTDIAKCSDWLLWMKILLESDLAFISEHLNYFRRHAGSVIARAEKPHYYYDQKMRSAFQEHLCFFSEREYVHAIQNKNKRLLFRDKFMYKTHQLKGRLTG